MNKKLLKFSTKELEDELHRRELIVPLILPMEEIGLEDIISFIEEEGVEKLSKGKHLNKEFYHKLTEIVVQTLYGDDGWEWWKFNNERNK